jgi:hypothetical protein
MPPPSSGMTSAMDVADSVRQVLAEEFRAFLQQFRNDHNAALAADRAFYTGLFNNFHQRLDRLELANILSSTSTSLEASGSTSFSSNSQTFHALVPASPVLLATQVGPPAGVREGFDEFLDTDDAVGSNDFAGISLSSDLDCHHAAVSGLPPSAALTVYAPDASAFQPAVSHDAPFRAHDWNAGVPMSTAAPSAAQPSWAPIPISYQLGVSAGGGNADVPMAVSPTLQPTWAPIPASYEPGVSDCVVHPALPDAEFTSLLGLQAHNPRVCALCRFPFTEKK